MFPWMDPTRSGGVGDPESWHDDDAMWHMVIDRWHREWAEDGSPPPSLEIIRDLGTLVVVGSETAADRYREAVVATHGIPKFIISPSLRARYPTPDGFDAYDTPASTRPEVVIDNDVFSALTGPAYGLRVDPVREIEGLFADGQFAAACDRVNVELGALGDPRRVVLEFLDEGDGTVRRLRFG